MTRQSRSARSSAHHPTAAFGRSDLLEEDAKWRGRKSRALFGRPVRASSSRRCQDVARRPLDDVRVEAAAESLVAVTTTTSVLLSAGVHERPAAMHDGSTRAPHRPARGASARIRPCAHDPSCARRSFDAATIFIAFVICCVFLTARIRRRRSIKDGITPPPLFLSRSRLRTP